MIWKMGAWYKDEQGKSHYVDSDSVSIFYNHDGKATNLNFRLDTDGFFIDNHFLSFDEFINTEGARKIMLQRHENSRQPG